MPARLRPDKPVPSIENKSVSHPDEFLQDKDFCRELSAPIFINEGVLVGFWFADATGRGARPVYCLVDRDFEYAYLEGRKFILVRWIDFDPFNVFGDWMGDDTEDNDCMNPDEVRAWVLTMWMSWKYAGNWDVTTEEDSSI
jgi:hypothetical protein